MSTDGHGSNGNHPRRPDAPPRLDGYELLGEVGRGGTGVVYKARQRGSGRLVAVKVIHSELLPDDPSERARKARDRCKAELEAASVLEHDNLIPLLEIGCSVGRRYCVTPWVEGSTLARLLYDSPLPNRRAAAYVEAAARAVHHAHMHGLVHRGLKPANVLIDAGDRALVAEFGLNGWLRGGAVPGAVLGTPAYLAPEQARGDVWADDSADIYALGAILYHALTGRPPFHAATAMETVRQVLADEPLPPRRLNPEVDRELEIICLKCLEKDPGRRYDSAADLADDLRRYLEGEPIRARGRGRGARLGRAFRHRPAAVALMLALLFALLASMSVAVFAASRTQRMRALSERMLAQEEQARAAALEANARAQLALGLDRRAQDRGGLTLAARTLRLADAEWQAGRPGRARDLLDEVPPRRRPGDAPRPRRPGVGGGVQPGRHPPLLCRRRRGAARLGSGDGRGAVFAAGPRRRAGGAVSLACGGLQLGRPAAGDGRRRRGAAPLGRANRCGAGYTRRASGRGRRRLQPRRQAAGDRRRRRDRAPPQPGRRRRSAGTPRA
jgi:hypothetical protein